MIFDSPGAGIAYHQRRMSEQKPILEYRGPQKRPRGRLSGRLFRLAFYLLAPFWLALFMAHDNWAWAGSNRFLFAGAAALLALSAASLVLAMLHNRD
jgi:hypothetical protein